MSARDDLADLTAREHLEAAWEAAHPVPPNVRIPKGMEYLVRISAGATPALRRAASDFRGGPLARTLDPLPPVIPDDCMAVRATGKCAPGLGRTIWQRSNDGTEWFAIDQADGSLWADSFSHLIDPKPVPEEER